MFEHSRCDLDALLALDPGISLSDALAVLDERSRQTGLQVVYAALDVQNTLAAIKAYRSATGADARTARREVDALVASDPQRWPNLLAG